jgi:hypothetical protein
MKKLSSVLALAALLGFGSSVLAEDKETTKSSTEATQTQPAAATQDENKDKAAPVESAEKPADASKENTGSAE